jgi:hypothetical protein
MSHCQRNHQTCPVGGSSFSVNDLTNYDGIYKFGQGKGLSLDFRRNNFQPRKLYLLPTRSGTSMKDTRKKMTHEIKFMNVVMEVLL